MQSQLRETLPFMTLFPMRRTGTKATTSYRVYSNAFMEGRNQQPHFEGRPGRSSARTGVPSIKSSAELVNASAVLGPASWARSVSPSTPCPEPSVPPFGPCHNMLACRHACLLRRKHFWIRTRCVASLRRFCKLRSPEVAAQPPDMIPCSAAVACSAGSLKVQCGAAGRSCILGGCGKAGQRPRPGGCA